MSKEMFRGLSPLHEAGDQGFAMRSHQAYKLLHGSRRRLLSNESVEGIQE